MRIMEPGGPAKGVVLSLFDASGRWARPWVGAGYRVYLVDLAHGDDMASEATIQTLAGIRHVAGILAAPPCTDFAGSGARWWKAKDADGRTAASIELVENTLRVVRHHQARGTLRWWALENPVGRLARLVPGVGEKRLTFHPCDYAGWALSPESEAFTKKTILWGDFNASLQQSRVEPRMYESAGKRGSWMWAKLGGKSERTKRLRSNTPTGFAQAFFWAQEVDR